MAKYDKLLDRILRGASDANIAFEDLRRFLKRWGFAERIRDDPHIFSKDGVEEILNLQPKGVQAKADKEGLSLRGAFATKQTPQKTKIASLRSQ